AKIHFGPELPYESRSVSVGEEPGMWCSHPSDSTRMIGITSAPETTFRAGNFVRQNYIVRITNDGGHTWKEAMRTSAAPVEIDPACAYGTDNQVFVAAMAFDGIRYRGVNLWRSSDEG